MSTALPMVCKYCKRPIGGTATYIGTWPYHYECTRGPVAPLTEEDVRRLVREELAAALQKHEKALQAATSMIRFGGIQQPNTEAMRHAAKE